MEEALPWLRWVEPEVAKLVWARAEGAPWKPICWRFAISRATADRRWKYGLSLIVWRLNGRRGCGPQRVQVQRMSSNSLNYNRTQ